MKLEDATNGRSSGPSQYSQHLTFSALSPNSLEDDEFYDDQKAEKLERRYSQVPFPNENLCTNICYYSQ